MAADVAGDEVVNGWPLSHVQQRHREALAAEEHRPLAVVVTTGAMNPIHLGHVYVLDCAWACLETRGYHVLGGWISPSHELYVAGKNSKPSFDAETRLRCCVAALEAEEGEGVAAYQCGFWECQQKGRWPDYGEVVKSLQQTLAGAGMAGITVFYASGMDHFLRCRLSRGLRIAGTGVVAIPRAKQGQAQTDEDKLVFAAEATSDAAADFLLTISSTEVRKYLVKKQWHEVERRVHPKVAEILRSLVDS